MKIKNRQTIKKNKRGGYSYRTIVQKIRSTQRNIESQLGFSISKAKQRVHEAYKEAFKKFIAEKYQDELNEIKEELESIGNPVDVETKLRSLPSLQHFFTEFLNEKNIQTEIDNIKYKQNSLFKTTSIVTELLHIIETHVPPDNVIRYDYRLHDIIENNNTYYLVLSIDRENAVYNVMNGYTKKKESISKDDFEEGSKKFIDTYVDNNTMMTNRRHSIG